MSGYMGCLVCSDATEDASSQQQPSLSKQYHLIIAADGLNSTLRSRYADHHSVRVTTIDESTPRVKDWLRWLKAGITLYFEEMHQSWQRKTGAAVSRRGVNRGVCAFQLSRFAMRQLDGHHAKNDDNMKFEAFTKQAMVKEDGLRYEVEERLMEKGSMNDELTKKMNMTQSQETKIQYLARECSV
eukprot:CCRYP_009451-RA/>CCRYP_009451-RA protein AED:0.51 eAED:0.39 QI:0/0/0.5/0.5/1/1/2/316/184